MSLFSTAEYRAGHQGYVVWKTQAATLVSPSATTAPSLQTGLSNVLGPCSLPGSNVTHNFTPVLGIGASKALDEVPGRKELDLSIRGLIADGTILTHCLRDRSDPDDAGLNKGLQQIVIEDGTDDVFGDGIATQYLDCVINTWSIRSQEGQPLGYDLGIIPMVDIPQTSPQSGVTAPDGDVLIWAYQSFTIGSTDYQPIISGVNLSGDNGVQRQGHRQMFGALGSELAISRTAYRLMPTMENLRLSVQLHDELPDAFSDTDTWGELTLRWEQAGSGSGRRYYQVVIDYSFLNSYQRPAVDANGILSWSVDTASYGFTPTYGLTT